MVYDLLLLSSVAVALIPKFRPEGLIARIPYPIRAAWMILVALVALAHLIVTLRHDAGTASRSS